MSLDRHRVVGMPICPNGNTIYCTPQHPCEGCRRVAAALAELEQLLAKQRENAAPTYMEDR